VMKALSLVLSVSIWAWLQTEQVVDRPSRATVTYAFPEGLTPVDEVARTLVVTVRGPQGRVRALEGQQLTMAVDLSEQQVGKASVDFSEQDITGLPDGLEIVQFSPPGAELQLDTIEIRGPQSKVRNIAEVSTDIVDVSGTRAPVERSVPLAIDHRTVRPTDQKKVTVSVGVDALIDTKSFNDVPVLVQQGWRADTPTARVTLKGPVPTLREIQASEVSVQVMLPDAVAPGAPVEVRWKPGTDNARFQIIHQAPRELITVESVRPDAIRLEPVLRPPAGVPAPAPEE
jgi:hypothetical protein